MRAFLLGPGLLDFDLPVLGRPCQLGLSFKVLLIDVIARATPHPQSYKGCKKKCSDCPKKGRHNNSRELN